MKKKQYFQDSKNLEIKVQATLLYLVNTNKDISLLLDQGCSVAQISLLLQKARKIEYIDRIDGKLTLTELGKETLKQLMSYIPKKKEHFIQPLYKDKIHRISLDTVYLPAKMEYHKLEEKESF